MEYFEPDYTVPSPIQLARSTNSSIEGLVQWLRMLRLQETTEAELMDVKLCFTSTTGAQHARNRLYRYRKALLHYIQYGDLNRLRSLPCVALFISNPEQGITNAEKAQLESYLNVLTLRVNNPKIGPHKSILTFTVFNSKAAYRFEPPAMEIVAAETEQSAVFDIALSVGSQKQTNNNAAREGTSASAEQTALSEYEQLEIENTNTFAEEMQSFREQLLELAAIPHNDYMRRHGKKATLDMATSALHKRCNYAAAYTEVIALAAALGAFTPKEFYAKELQRRYPDIFAQYK